MNNKSILLAGLLVIIAGCTTADKQTKGKISRFNWLNGYWIMKQDSTGATENWKQVNDTLMEGSSANIKGDSIIPFETVKLYQNGTDYFYDVKSSLNATEPVVSFKMTSFTDTSFIVENPQHDFPKRIGYTLINKDSIYAFIDGGTAKPDDKIGFSYRRSKNK